MFLIPARFTFGADFLLLSSPTGVLSTQIILQSRVTRVTFHKTGDTIIINTDVFKAGLLPVGIFIV